MCNLPRKYLDDHNCAVGGGCHYFAVAVALALLSLKIANKYIPKDPKKSIKLLNPHKVSRISNS